MYTTCLFCHGNLERNEVVEHFPVGRRLAFDATKGRLWVVCRRCERWNLTPVEERWEAIEECERAFSETRLRVSTDEIGLARVKEGLELVRIGAPQRPEMAAWRYGDQFGRRMRRSWGYAGVVAAVGGLITFAPQLIGVAAMGGVIMPLGSLSHQLYLRRRVAARVRSDDGRVLRVLGAHLDQAAIRWDTRAQDWRLELAHHDEDTRWWDFQPSSRAATLSGQSARDAAPQLLARLNDQGASKRRVRSAVDLLVGVSEPDALFGETARTYSLSKRSPEGVMLKTVTPELRLALEMASNESSERRALEGELHLLEERWRDAEEIAAIADNLLLPDGVDDNLARLKTQHQDEG